MELKKKILKYIKSTSTKIELQMGMAFLDYKTLKKLGIENGEQLCKIFGADNIVEANFGKGFNVKWK